MESNSSGREECLRLVTRVITQAQNAELIAPILSQEV